MKKLARKILSIIISENFCPYAAFNDDKFCRAGSILTWPDNGEFELIDCPIHGEENE